MMFNILACSSLILSPEAFKQDQQIAPYKSLESLLHQKYQLSNSDRDRLFCEAEFAAMKAQMALEQAEDYFSKITEIDIRDACTSAVVGCISSFTACGSKWQVVNFAIGSVAHYVSSQSEYFWKGYDCLQDAKVYAEHCDSCQEALWRD